MNLSKIQGCLAGLALGDAMGMPTEFLTPDQINETFGWVDGLKQAPDWHPHALLPAGYITDDTGQALAIAHACLPDGLISAERAAHHLLEWEGALPEEILKVIEGPSTRSALELLRIGENPRCTGKNGRTNGAAMRCAVIGLLHGGDLDLAIQAAIEASLPTHATCIALSGAASVACAVAAASTQNSTLPYILMAARYGASQGAQQGIWTWSTPLSSRIELATQIVKQSKEPSDALQSIYHYVGVDMLVPESVAAAMGIVLLAGGDPMKAVIYGANIGGDTDTIAAIAGQICGAYRGIDALDESMLNQIEATNHLDLALEAQLIENMIEEYHSSVSDRHDMPIDHKTAGSPTT